MLPGTVRDDGRRCRLAPTRGAAPTGPAEQCSYTLQCTFAGSSTRIVASAILFNLWPHSGHPSRCGPPDVCAACCR